MPTKKSLKIRDIIINRKNHFNLDNLYKKQKTIPLSWNGFLNFNRIYDNAGTADDTTCEEVIDKVRESE